MLSIGLVILSLVGILLAAPGLHALVSVTVSQRTREIGIRTALGAGAGDVVVTIARRAFLQLASGVGLGSATGVALTITILTALACLAPTLRGLRVQPMEALAET